MKSRHDAYVPGPTGTPWETIGPADAGFNGAALRKAVDFATHHESPWPRSLYYPDGRYVGIVEWNETGPWSEIVGRVAPRGGPAGLVLKGGGIVAEWGDTDRTDMTFSIAKSYLALLAGLAVADGLIADIEAPVADSIDSPLLAGAHNRQVSWRHLLQQSSEWQGEIFGKSDQVDHRREVGPGADNSRKGERRELQAPGSYYEYNDVRVNLLSYCLLQRFGRPLPDVLSERIMAPIGASADWSWEGYRNAMVDVGGKQILSVPGGGHWGGGLFIGARDHARIGLLVARSGQWGDRELLPRRWIEAMLAPSPTNEGYGYLWWLNRGKGYNPRLPASSVSAMGAGTNLIWIDPERDLVVVLRWIDKNAVQGFLERLVAALEG